MRTFKVRVHSIAESVVNVQIASFVRVMPSTILRCTCDLRSLHIHYMWAEFRLASGALAVELDASEVGKFG